MADLKGKKWKEARRRCCAKEERAKCKFEEKEREKENRNLNEHTSSVPPISPYRLLLAIPRPRPNHQSISLKVSVECPPPQAYGSGRTDRTLSVEDDTSPCKVNGAAALASWKQTIGLQRGASEGESTPLGMEN